MILTCPACSTRYFADAALEGVRRVRCAACGHAWRPGRPDRVAQIGEAGAAFAASLAAAAASAVRPLAPGAPDMRASLMKWAAVAMGVVLLMILAVAYRFEVVGFWPGSASFYAAAGFEVTREGVVIDSVGAAPGTRDGERTLTVTGLVRNDSGRARTIPPIRIELQDEAGKEAFAWTVRLDLDELGAGKAARFSSTLMHPPAEAVDLEVKFAREGTEGAVSAAAVVE